MSVVSKLYLVQASFFSVNSNIDSTLRLVSNDVNAYIEALGPRITARNEVSDEALSVRVLKNCLLTEQYSGLILKQRIPDIGAPIDIATLPANAAAAALDDAVALETIRLSTAGSSPTTTHYHNGSGSINRNADQEVEAVMEILQQAIMNLALASAAYCDEAIKMNPTCT